MPQGSLGHHAVHIQHFDGVITRASGSQATYRGRRGHNRVYKSGMERVGLYSWHAGLKFYVDFKWQLL